VDLLQDDNAYIVLLAGASLSVMFGLQSYFSWRGVMIKSASRSTHPALLWMDFFWAVGASVATIIAVVMTCVFGFLLYQGVTGASSAN